VLAAHVDDEAIGCGGTLLLHRQVNDPVHIVYVLEDPPRRQVREQEGDRIGKRLGATITHLRCSADSDAIVAALRPILLHERPDVLYVPWALDNHEGHLVVNYALGQLLQEGVECGELWCYEVWTPLIPNRIVDITDLMDQKQHLLQQYPSQLATNDIVSMGLGLARYRGGFLSRKDAAAAEVFLALSSTEYRQLGQALAKK